MRSIEYKWEYGVELLQVLREWESFCFILLFVFFITFEKNTKLNLIEYLVF